MRLFVTLMGLSGMFHVEQWGFWLNNTFLNSPIVDVPLGDDGLNTPPTTLNPRQPLAVYRLDRPEPVKPVVRTVMQPPLVLCPKPIHFPYL